MLKAAVVLALIGSMAALAALPRDSGPSAPFNIVDIDGAPVLSRDSGGYLLDLGTLGPGDVRSYPHAFLLVNEVESAMKILCASVDGDLARMLVVHARLPGKSPEADLAERDPQPRNVRMLYSPETGPACDGAPLVLSAGDGDFGTASGSPTGFDEGRGVSTLGSRAEPRTGGDAVLIGLMLKPGVWEREGVVTGVIDFRIETAA
jgi:hypothetical protein